MFINTQAGQDMYLQPLLLPHHLKKVCLSSFVWLRVFRLEIIKAMCVYWNVFVIGLLAAQC